MTKNAKTPSMTTDPPKGDPVSQEDLQALREALIEEYSQTIRRLESERDLSYARFDVLKARHKTLRKALLLFLDQDLTEEEYRNYSYRVESDPYLTKVQD